MTSISQQVLPSQPSSTASQTAIQALPPSGPASGKSLPSIPGAVSAPSRSHATAHKKQFSPTSASATTSASVAVGSSATAYHGKADSMNGKGVIPPAVPALGAPTIVNGNAAIAHNTTLGDHGRKASVTITAAGTSGYLPNGGPMAGKPTTGNNIQFGQLPTQGSPILTGSAPQPVQSSNTLAVQTPSNPRITSPQTSPSPIPQPPASGGRPPSGFQGQGNGLNFGSIGNEERQMRSAGIPQGPLGPGPSHGHLRRESSQSAHNEMGNPGMLSGGGRGGYSQQSSRGRGGYAPHYPPQIGYAPATGFRPPPSQPRNGQSVGPSFPPQARSLAPYANPPHPGPRSPVPTNAQLVHPQPGQMPMANPQMYPQPYNGYPPNMGAPQNQYGMAQGFDPNYAAYYHPQHFASMHPLGYMPPSSPRQHQQIPSGPQQQYIPGQYNNPPQTQQMSRNSSAISASDRPTSSLGKSHTPGPPPALMHSGPSSNRHAPSPAPVAPSDFKIPQRRGAGIQIKDPTSGGIITFDKPSASPASSNRSPAIVSSSPPPQLGSSHVDGSHQRTESKSVQATEKIKHDIKDAVVKKVEADKAEEKRLKEEAAAKALEEQKEAAAKVAKAEEEAKAKQLEEEKARLEAEEVIRKAKADAEEAEKATAKAKEEADRAQKEKEEEEEFARIEAELEREEREEREAEERYKKKKQAEKEEKARQEAEAAARIDEEMKKAEREMEEAEDRRFKKLEGGEGEESRMERQSLFAALKKDGSATPSSETPAAVDTPGESGTVTPVSDMSMPPPSRVTKSKPAHLKLETSKNVEPAQPSAALLSLRSARRLTSITDVSYPAPFASPNPALNSAAPNGKFRYDKEFLMQFQRAFVEKPSENWTERIKETVGDTTEPSSARAPPARGAPLMNARQLSNRGPMPAMGNFGAQGGRTLPPGSTSQSRYQVSTPGLVSAQKNPMQNPLANFVANRPGGFPVSMSKTMERTPSSTSLAGNPSSPRPNPSQRGGGGRGSRSGRSTRDTDKLAKEMPLTYNKELKPIEVTASGWKPHSMGTNVTGVAGPAPGGDGHMPPDVVQRKVKANLNKMTPNNFEKISDQILSIAGQSKDETDGRTLRQVIQLTFEKATDEAHWAQMYAEFCKRMLESMSPEIKDVRILDKKDNVVVGGALFRKYLLTRCQEEFERGWKIDLPQKPEGEPTEAAMLSDEYYIAATAKRRGLGLVRFIGELYKLGMLTERIMHECVKKLVDYEGTPDEAEVESLTSLLKTIGENLDSTERGPALMDAYFKRIGIMVETPDLPSRLKFMLMDIVDLRKKHWHSKGGAIKGPTTLEEVRVQAVAAEREKEAQRMQDTGSRRGGGGGSGRMPMGRGDARNFSGGQYGMMPPPDYQRNTVGMEDLRRLGSRGGSRQVSSQGNAVFAPTSMFATRGSNTRKPLGAAGIAKGGEDSAGSSRTGTPPAQKERKEKEEKEAAKHANVFSPLEGLNDASNEAGDPASPPSAASSPPDAKAKSSHRSKSPLGQATQEDHKGDS